MASRASEPGIDFEALRLLRAFFAIDSCERRRVVVDLAEQIAHGNKPVVRAHLRLVQDGDPCSNL